MGGEPQPPHEEVLFWRDSDPRRPKRAGSARSPVGAGPRRASRGGIKTGMDQSIYCRCTDILRRNFLIRQYVAMAEEPEAARVTCWAETVETGQRMERAIVGTMPGEAGSLDRIEESPAWTTNS